MRLSHVVLFTVLCVLGACVYHVANLYQTAERQMKRLDVSIERENENIRVLSAEWAFLTNPVRLEKLAQDYLHLQAMDGSQLVALSNMPLRETLNEMYPEEPASAVLASAATESAPVALPAAMPPAMPTMKALPVSTGVHSE